MRLLLYWLSSANQLKRSDPVQGQTNQHAGKHVRVLDPGYAEMTYRKIMIVVSDQVGKWRASNTRRISAAVFTSSPIFFVLFVFVYTPFRFVCGKSVRCCSRRRAQRYTALVRHFCFLLQDSSRRVDRTFFILCLCTNTSCSIASFF